MFLYNDAQVCILNGDGYVISGAPSGLTSGHTYLLSLQPAPETVHGMTVQSGARAGVCTTFDNNCYVSVWELYTTDNVRYIDNYFATLDIIWNAAGDGITHRLSKVEPSDISATKAVNYGYNMLKDSPYTFTNSVTSNTEMVGGGIIPYDASGNVVVSARSGDELTFKLNYQYPSSHVDSKTYNVQWEIQDLNNADGTSNTVVSAYESIVYNPGDVISYWTNQTAYKQFTLTCKVYDHSDVLTAQAIGKTALEFELNYTPLLTMTASFYYLTDDKSTTAQNSSSVNYNLNTAQGMCTWQQRLVLWGVKNSRNTLWVSEINDPSYFPYPNNVEVFDSDIVACVKYKTYLLVFTETALYQMAFAEDGLTLTTSCLQDRLALSTGDASSIVPVQSMVAFKTDNYYYMVVPAASTTTIAGELTLAPVSRPINDLFDSFLGALQSLTGLFRSCYNVSDSLTVNNIALQDWWCYLEGNQIRPTYKVKFDVGTVTHYVDFSMCYDIKSRAWTARAEESTSYRPAQLKTTATGDSTYIYVGDALQICTEDEHDPMDDHVVHVDAANKPVTPLAYLDTGYRDITDYTNVNKKWRQLQYTINNLEANTQMMFENEFICDGDKRLKNSRYEVDYDEDTQDYVYTPETLDDDDEGYAITEQVVDDISTCRWKGAEWGYDTTNLLDGRVARVKQNINAKGRLGRLQMVSHNSAMYELSQISWVYRIMTAR